MLDPGCQAPRFVCRQPRLGLKAHMQLKDMRYVMETAHQIWTVLAFGSREHAPLREMIELGMGSWTTGCVGRTTAGSH